MAELATAPRPSPRSSRPGAGSRRASLTTALEEAKGRQRTSERALAKAEADAAGSATLVTARVEAEQTLADLDEQLARPGNGTPS